MSDILFETIVRTAKANAYEQASARCNKLRMINFQLVEALELAMKQLEDAEGDIRLVREKANLAIQKARRYE